MKMLLAKKCEFCGLSFVNADGRESNFCPKCSDVRRKIAGRHFLARSGRSRVIGNYLLSERLARRLGLVSAS